MEPLRIDVRHPEGRGYPIEVAAGLGARLPAALDALGIGAARVVVSTAPVWRAVAPRMAPELAEVEPILIPDGERSKTLATVSRLYEALLRADADRATTVVAVGGGVLGDTAGFAAATYLRGLSLVHVPTTLVAQVDSAIGGKVGVNLPAAKNAVGAFHRPLAVLTDPLFLGTLARREFRAGLYEVLKYGVIASADLFALLAARLSALFAREPEALVPVIAEACRIKARVVADDERDAGERRVLNFGHTAGHALEAITRFRRFRHGEAVGYGMLVASRLAVARGAMPEGDHAAIVGLIAQMGPLPPVGDLSTGDAIDAMRRDKKVLAGRLHVVLPLGIGRAAVVDDVTEAELRAALAAVGLRG